MRSLAGGGPIRWLRSSSSTMVSGKPSMHCMRARRPESKETGFRPKFFDNRQSPTVFLKVTTIVHAVKGSQRSYSKEDFHRYLRLIPSMGCGYSCSIWWQGPKDVKYISREEVYPFRVILNS